MPALCALTVWSRVGDQATGEHNAPRSGVALEPRGPCRHPVEDPRGLLRSTARAAGSWRSQCRPPASPPAAGRASRRAAWGCDRPSVVISGPPSSPIVIQLRDTPLLVCRLAPPTRTCVGEPACYSSLNASRLARKAAGVWTGIDPASLSRWSSPETRRAFSAAASAMR